MPNPQWLMAADKRALEDRALLDVACWIVYIVCGLLFGYFVLIPVVLP